MYIYICLQVYICVSIYILCNPRFRETIWLAPLIHVRKRFPAALMKFLRDVPLAGMPQLPQSGAKWPKLSGGIRRTVHKTSLSQLPANHSHIWYETCLKMILGCAIQLSKVHLCYYPVVWNSSHMCLCGKKHPLQKGRSHPAALLKSMARCWKSRS